MVFGLAAGTSAAARAMDYTDPLDDRRGLWAYTECGLQRVASVPTHARAPSCLQATAMPTYEFRCKKCGTVFERQEHIAEHENSHPSCPNCKGDAVEPVLADFYAVTAKKS
jgi:putative FmdB family regulatory protein